MCLSISIENPLVAIEENAGWGRLTLIASHHHCMENNLRTMTQVTFPGLFDLQVNGFAGVDFNEPRTSEAELLRAIATMRATGVTRFLPMLITSSFENFSAAQKIYFRSITPPLRASTWKARIFLPMTARTVRIRANA